MPTNGGVSLPTREKMEGFASFCCCQPGITPVRWWGDGLGVIDKTCESEDNEKWQNCEFNVDQSMHGSSFRFPATWISRWRVQKETKNQRGECSPPDSDPLTAVSLEKTSLVSQDNLPEARLAHSPSRNAVSNSSARTMKRFPYPRRASAIHIIRFG